MNDLIELLRQSNDEIDHAAADEIEALEKVRVAVLKHRDNKEFLNIDTWNACVYAAEAATKQRENRYDATKE